MAEQLRPEQVGSLLADFERRLRNMETTARSGLNRIQSAKRATVDNGVGLVVDGGFGDLSVANSPSVTVTTGTKVLVMGSVRAVLGPAAAYRHAGSYISYAISGATTAFPVVGVTASGDLVGDGGGTLIGTLNFIDLVTVNAGVNVFSMKYAYSTALGGAASGTFQNPTIVVIPLNL